jgi:hypothetical protein
MHMFQHDAWRRGDRFPGLAIGAIAPDTAASAVETEAAGPSVLVAPFSVTVSFAPAADPRSYAADGPRLIEIARPTQPRAPLPLVIYGDPGA